MTFDDAGKISQIRLQWDQGSLLKQVEIIGKSGRNWPIRDSREQIAFIQACIKSVGTNVSSTVDHNESINRNRGNSTNAFRDPHASLKLFGPREEIEGPPDTVISPYAGTRPQQRSFTEILGDEPDSPSADRQRAISPSKGGQGKNFQPMRIFDGHQDHPEPSDPKPKQYIRPNPKKYSHFDFADGTDPQDAPKPGHSFDERPKSKHDSQWNFDDFMTPQKVKPGRTMNNQTTQNARQWDTDKDAMGETSTHQPAGKPRRDAETHFELQDEAEPVPHADRPGAKPRGFTNEDSSSFHDRALGNITNLKGRGKDFDPHFSISDNSPAHPQQPQHISEARKKAVKMMDANWSSYDKSPSASKENNPFDTRPVPGNRIHIAGDGMGGRQGANRDWLYGGSNDDAPQAPPTRKPNADPVTSGNPNSRIHIAGDGMGGKRGTDRDWLYEDSAPAPKAAPSRKPGSGPAGDDEFDDTRINIAGDGMGGRKGTDRDWLYNEQNQAPKAVPTRTPGTEVQSSDPKDKRINIAGDGMGGRKGTDRDWLYDESNEAPQSVPTRKPGAEVQSSDPKDKRINIAGDGMGGRRGTDRDWLYGEMTETSQQPRKQNATASAKKDFWDF